MSDEGPGPRGGSSDEATLPDGAEAPPPGVRTMSIVRWGLVVLMAIAASGAWLHHVTSASTGSTRIDEGRFRCPMHPAVVQERPGSCPICGMDLVAATLDPAARAGTGRTTGAAIAQPARAGGGASASAATGPAASPGRYWCPMHPEVASDDPEARCERCGGMKLLPRDAGGDAAETGVPGLVAVDLGAERAQRIGVRTATVARERLPSTLRAVGFVSANESSLAIVGARYTGWIEETRVAQAGQRVAKGQVLATVYSQELVTAETAYLNAVRWSEKQAGSAAGPTTGSGIEGDARRKLELLGVAREDIRHLAESGQVPTSVPIRSPVAGFVARKAAVPGLYVQPGTELFQIVDLSSVWVLADVHEADIPRIRAGQAALLQLAAYPGETFAGRVQFVYPAVSPETRTLQARVELRNPDLKLRPGMYGDVQIDAGAVDALAVPADAVVDTGEVQYVLLARDGGRFEPRRVRLGMRRDDRVQVLEGVKAGDRVVTTANFLVDSESRLRAALQGFRAPSPSDPRAEGGHGDAQAPAHAGGNAR